MSRRLLWGLYCAGSGIGVGLLATGPTLETRLAPVRAEQSIPAGGVQREAGRLCFDWVSRKLRDAEWVDIDVAVTFRRPEGFDRASSMLVLEPSGALWSRMSVVSADPRLLRRDRLCALLPPGLPASTAVRVDATVIYRGLLGLWNLRVPMPPILDPPDAPGP